ncbi:peptide chain release factor N(5)-glutamine methyltransferase [Rubrivivax gelatinosus]|uniref:Release factor glutamine methyltransferase n=1 Tax=Rubrivivax gelatinosus TaxID=28068 RepID=A0A4R2M0R5_RUBGE|nr:peptide chain release factor N(5)-glutamine methyltransferase [Rubrivivax gelatinosus]MBK1687085.1 protein-(glutamine-N5) methyltransferase, release factor-specific [Rubrivivax gelatinosus]TCP00599.1 [protein release factor]-glutamine N5-methyltransferase [Rubrivivax gelatinosus]
MRIADALAAGRELGVDRLDTQLLLAHRLGRSRAWLLAHDEDLLSPASAAAFAADLARRAAGVPFAYLVGEREFHGLTLRVTPDVLVPRPDTEVLVDWALALLPPGAPARVADLGTGSGAIALAVKHARPQVAVTATDRSAEALAVAADNAHRLGLDIDLVHGPWWQPLAGRQFDLVLSNPPYIAGADPHLAALTHEPRGALTPEGDGLDALREIVAGAAAHLQPGAWLLLEHGYDQAEPVQVLLADAGFREIATHRDLGGQPRCTGGRR